MRGRAGSKHDAEVGAVDSATSGGRGDIEGSSPGSGAYRRGRAKLWNRVVLLTCGMAIGWGLANYWTCSPEEMARHRYRVTLGAIVALALCLWIAWDDPASGILALSFVAVTALVAYAARARQISSVVDRATPPQVTDVPPGADRVIILVSYALPGAYTGPEHWVWYLRRPRGAAEPDRGWFSRPRTLKRIRAGYQRLGSPANSCLTLSSVQERLQTLLGPEIQFAMAHPFAAPRLETQLVALASQGTAAAVVAPIDLNDASEAELEQRIALSQVEEQGVQVVLLTNTRLEVWDERRALEQVEALSRGLPLPDMMEPALERLDALAHAINEHVFVPMSPGLQEAPGQETPGDA